jgi:tetratricopeptide (TPR) repeat protein
MEAISTQFRRQGAALRSFEKQLTAYRQRRHEAETPMATTLPGSAEVAGSEPTRAASLSSTMVAQAGLVGLGMVPGMGAIAGAMDPQQVAQSADRVRAALSARLRSHADVELVMSPVQVLTPVFLEDLAQIAERRPSIVLFFDVFEQTGPVLNEWLRDILVGEEYPGLPVNVLAVLSGQGRLDARCWGDHLDLVTEVPLAVFTEEEARKLLASRGVTSEDVIQVILNLTGRLPVLVDTLALNRPQEPGAVTDPSETAVERFLKWINDPHQQDAARACAFPLQLDEDIYRATVPEATADHYSWLRSLPFVSDQAGRCRYHDVVRTPMIRLQRTQSPARWQQQHTRLADLYQQRRLALEDVLSPSEHWDNDTWRDHRLNETYHRLCANPKRALSGALHDIVQACDNGTASLRRLAQLLSQAGHDSADANLTLWGDRLTTVSRDEATGLIAALTQTLAASELEVVDRTLAYTLRGREHRHAKKYGEALNDYSSALALDPQFARALYGQGETWRLMGHYERALPSLNRAIELEADDAWNFDSRALVYRAIGRYEEALNDHNRAIEFDPNNAWVITSRGDTHREMGRYDDALTDHNRAIELDPEDPWNRVKRGLTYEAMGRHDDALKDYDRAVERAATRAWAYTARAQIYRRTHRYDEALTDHNRAIELEPEDVWVVVNRGETYRAMERYEDALADHNRAIEFDPNNAWVITSRGDTHREMGRYDDALTDHNRAIELDPEDPWNTAKRGLTYEAMGRHDDALRDYDHTVERAATRAWAYTRRALIYRRTHRYEEALTDHNRAVEVAPDDAWHFSNRGDTYREMRRYDDALTDHNRAIELDPEDPWNRVKRGLTYEAMGRHDDALKDYDRAVERAATRAWAYTARAQIYRRTHRYDEALTDHNRAIELDPNNAWHLSNRGDTYRAVARYDDAIADHNRAIELDPNNASAVSNRGDTYHDMERYDDAIADHNRAIELDPNNAWHFSNRGDTYRAVARYEDAIADHNRAIELDPNNAWHFSSRGDTYRAVGRYDDALADHNRAIELDPNNAWYYLDCAVALHILGRPEEQEYLRRAAERCLIEIESSPQGPRITHVRGNLMVIYCAAREWNKASEELQRFLACAPGTVRIHEALKDLSDLQEALQEELSQVQPLRLRLEDAVGRDA